MKTNEPRAPGGILEKIHNMAAELFTGDEGANGFVCTLRSDLFDILVDAFGDRHSQRPGEVARAIIQRCDFLKCCVENSKWIPRMRADPHSVYCPASTPEGELNGSD